MKTLLYAFLGFFTVSCISISGSISGLTDDYGSLNDQLKSRIIPATDFAKTDTLHIYKVNANHLKTELNKYPKAMVYVFTNGCKSNYCLPMSAYQDFSEQNNYKLFLVMNGFGMVNETLKQRSEIFTEPLFAIDGNHYGSKIRTNYTTKFENELRGFEQKGKSKYEGNLFFFENGKLVKTTHDLR